MKLVVADPKTGKTYQTELDEGKAKTLQGKKLKENVKGDALGMTGYELQITGGSDNQGFPMRDDFHGSSRKRLLLSSGPGFHPHRKGERKRVSVRGNTISNEIAQVNAKVVKQGEKALDKLFSKEGAEKKEEKKEEHKHEKKEEVHEKKEEKKEAPAKEEKHEKKEEHEHKEEHADKKGEKK